MTSSAEWGILTDYVTGEPLRPATREECELSAQAVRNGVPEGIWRDDDTHFAAVFVDGGPEIRSA